MCISWLLCYDYNDKDTNPSILVDNKNELISLKKNTLIILKTKTNWKVNMINVKNI